MQQSTYTFWKFLQKHWTSACELPQFLLSNSYFVIQWDSVIEAVNKHSWKDYIRSSCVHAFVLTLCKNRLWSLCQKHPWLSNKAYLSLALLQDHPPRACGALSVQGDWLHWQPQQPCHLPGARGSAHHNHTPSPWRPVNQPDLTLRDQVSTSRQQVTQEKQASKQNEPILPLANTHQIPSSLRLLPWPMCLLKLLFVGGGNIFFTLTLCFTFFIFFAKFFQCLDILSSYYI